MTGDTYAVDRERLEAACAMMTAAGDPKLPLMRAAADGRIALAWAVHPSATWPLEAVEAVRLPVVFLVGDDPWPIGEAQGPAGWAVAKRLKEWARAVIVHGAGGAPEHYREGVHGALYAGRCAIIETSSARAAEWAKFLRCPATLLILPQGGAHPVPPTGQVRH